MKNQEKKNPYVRPVVEIIKFDSEDVITTSSFTIDLPDDDLWNPNDNIYKPEDYLS